MIDLSESFDTRTLTEKDLWQSEMDLKTSGRNKHLFGWPFTSTGNKTSPYSLLRNESRDSQFTEKNLSTVSDTNLVRDLHLKGRDIPNFKYPKFIPIYDANKTILDRNTSLNTSHPIPWLDIEATCFKMNDSGTVADLSRYLAEGKLYALNDVSKKDIKKLESRSNTSVNLDEAYSNEDVMDMYRMMHEMRRERQKVKKTRNNKVRPSSSGSSLSLSDLSMDSNIDDMDHKRQTNANVTGFECESLQSFGISEDASTESETTNASDGKLSNNFNISNDNENPSKMSKPSPRRFGDANERHCEAVANLVKKRLFSSKNKTRDDGPVVDLYVELTEGRIRPLCHIKTGMANLCLNTFFFPCTNIASVTWVNNIQDTIFRKIFRKFDPLKDIFGAHIRRLDVSDIKAVLFVSPAAKNIIKHKDLCMLDTLPETLGIQQGSLVLLNMEQKPDDLI